VGTRPFADFDAFLAELIEDRVARLGAAHLLFAGRDGTPPQPEVVRKVVTTVLAGVMP
jgi:hypothetical protein